MRNAGRAAIISLALSLGMDVAPGWSQTPTDGEPAATLPWYQVEIIVFEQRIPPLETGEEFTPPAPSLGLEHETPIPLEGGASLPAAAGSELPSGDDDVAGGAPEMWPPGPQREIVEPDESEEPEPGPPRPPRFFPVPAEALTLSEELRRLRSLDAYEPLLVLAWAQQGWPAEEAPTVPVDAFGDAPVELTGELRMYRSRYLHLNVALELDPEAAASSLPRAQLAPELTPASGKARYVIRARRRMRSNELHYVDHPKFGVLAVIRPLEEAPPAAAGQNATISPP